MTAPNEALGRDPIAAEIERVTQKIGRLKAAQLLKEMRQARDAMVATRKADARKRHELGQAVFTAGLKDWEPSEITGMLLDAHDRMAGSPTIRLAFRKRGEAQRSVARNKSQPSIH